MKGHHLPVVYTPKFKHFTKALNLAFEKQGRKCADFQLAFLCYDHATTPLANSQQVLIGYFRRKTDLRRS